nr:IclR family transcriptional regulator C-terminal domain-containing protein [Sulfitobacter undariae]
MPKLIDLSQRIGETVNLAELSGSRVIYSARLPCTRTIFAASIPGRTVPALNTSSGQAILATLPRHEREAAIRDWPLHEYTSRTTLDRAEIADQIEQVIQTGYAITQNQMILGEIAVACAIRGPSSIGVAAVQCSISTHHWDEARIKSEILPWLLDAANAISPTLRP